MKLLATFLVSTVVASGRVSTVVGVSTAVVVSTIVGFSTVAEVSTVVGVLLEFLGTFLPATTLISFLPTFLQATAMRLSVSVCVSVSESVSVCATVSKETYYSVKRDLLVSKETYYSVKRDHHAFECQCECECECVCVFACVRSCACTLEFVQRRGFVVEHYKKNSCKP